MPAWPEGWLLPEDLYVVSLPFWQLHATWKKITMNWSDHNNRIVAKLKQDIKPDPMSIRKTTSNERPFSPLNFWLMGGCVILILLGYLFMSGGGSADPEEFNPDIFSTRRIVVGPLLSFLGFLLMAFAIICPPHKRFKFLSRFYKDKSETGN